MDFAKGSAMASSSLSTGGFLTPSWFILCLRAVLTGSLNDFCLPSHIYFIVSPLTYSVCFPAKLTCSLFSDPSISPPACLPLPRRSLLPVQPGLLIVCCLPALEAELVQGPPSRRCPQSWILFGVGSSWLLSMPPQMSQWAREGLLQSQSLVFSQQLCPLEGPRSLPGSPLPMGSEGGSCKMPQKLRATWNMLSPSLVPLAFPHP